MTVSELSKRMDSRELSEWQAVDRYFMRLPDSWQQTGVIAASAIAPHTQGKPPQPSAIAGLLVPPQHPLQVRDALSKLAAELEG